MAKVIPNFLSLVALTMLFILCFAIIGSTIFSDAFEIVLSDETPTSNFDTLFDSTLTLVQFMVGKGWNDLMNLSVLALKSFFVSIYFIMYVNVVCSTIINCCFFLGLFCRYLIIIALLVSNIFVGLILGEMANLDQNIKIEKVIWGEIFFKVLFWFWKMF